MIFKIDVAARDAGTVIPVMLECANATAAAATVNSLGLLVAGKAEPVIAHPQLSAADKLGVSTSTSAWPYIGLAGLAAVVVLAYGIYSFGKSLEKSARHIESHVFGQGPWLVEDGYGYYFVSSDGSRVFQVRRP